MNPSGEDLTVIGLYSEDGNEYKITQLVGGEISSSKLIEIIEKVEILYTYNGSRFDLPYIKAKIGTDLTKYRIHKDLVGKEICMAVLKRLKGNSVSKEN